MYIFVFRESAPLRGALILEGLDFAAKIRSRNLTGTCPIMPCHCSVRSCSDQLKQLLLSCFIF